MITNKQTPKFMTTIACVMLVMLTIACSKKEDKVTDITLSVTKAIVEKETSFMLFATILPDNASDKSLIWFSNDTTIATVSPDGLVTGISCGTAYISCVSGDKQHQATSQINVIEPLAMFYNGILTVEQQGIFDAKMEITPAIAYGDNYSGILYGLSIYAEIDNKPFMIHSGTLDIMYENGKNRIHNDTTHETYPTIIDGFIDAEGAANINIHIAMEPPMVLLFEGIKE